MGNDQPLAVFSKNHPPLARYVKQTITDVTNPPLDHLHEGGAFDLRTFLDPRPKAQEHAFEYNPRLQVKLQNPILTERQMQFLYSSSQESKPKEKRKHNKIPPIHRFDTTFQRQIGEHGSGVSALRARIEEIKREAIRMAKARRFSILAFSDRGMRDDK
jgi:hypothetical protein